VDELSQPFVVILIGCHRPGRGVTMGFVSVVHVITGLDVGGVRGVDGEPPFLVESHD
jgi:hypothetical protein